MFTVQCHLYECLARGVNSTALGARKSSEGWNYLGGGGGVVVQVFAELAEIEMSWRESRVVQLYSEPQKTMSWPK